jgi:hypothetical protein
MVKFLDEPFGDLHRPNIDVGLYGDIHQIMKAAAQGSAAIALLPSKENLMRTGGLEVPRQSRKTV